jgi:hypothetical protein
MQLAARPRHRRSTARPPRRFGGREVHDTAWPPNDAMGSSVPDSAESKRHFSV